MPEKNETIICATRARHGIIAIMAWQHVARDWTLAPAPTNLNTGGCSAVVPPALPLARTRN